MIINNLRMGWQSIKSAKLRNFFTMLGVIIGVASVLVVVSIGEGVRSQVQKQVDVYGKDLILVQPGKTVARNSEGEISTTNLFANSTRSVLDDDDYRAVVATAGVEAVAPLSVISGTIAYDQKTSDDMLVVATTPEYASILKQKVAFGQFFTEQDGDGNFVVIGRHVAESFFNENVPIGRRLQFRGQEFTVKGVFDSFGAAPLPGSFDFDNTIFLPYLTGQNLTDGSAAIHQMFVRADSKNSTGSVIERINQNLAKLRGGAHDFTVLRQEETVQATSGLVRNLTALVAVIGAVTLVVGGVGIMNVMLVSVTERTHEIGVRKAVGATNRQIMQQFLVESMLLCTIGSIIGCLIALAAGILLYLFTDLTPVISWPVVVVAILAALVSGILFGVLPALKAARKDPIEALRNGQ